MTPDAAAFANMQASQYRQQMALGQEQGRQQSSGNSLLALSLDPSAPGSVSQELLAEVRVRAGVLCAVFVFASSTMLSLKLTGVAQGHQLQFEGTVKTFQKLLFIVETSLHLLCLHFTLLATVDTGSRLPTPSLSGIPRLAVVGQYLRLVIDFAKAAA